MRSVRRAPARCRIDGRTSLGQRSVRYPPDVTRTLFDSVATLAAAVWFYVQLFHRGQHPASEVCATYFGNDDVVGLRIGAGAVDW